MKKWSPPLPLLFCSRLKKLRSPHYPPAPEMVLEENPVCDNVDHMTADSLRVGDGRSSSSSCHSHSISVSSCSTSEEDSCSVTVATDTSSVMQDEMDELVPLNTAMDVSMASGVSLFRQQNRFSSGYVQLCVGSQEELALGRLDLCLGGREEPDGCSISSGSVDLGTAVEVND